MVGLILGRERWGGASPVIFPGASLVISYIFLAIVLLSFSTHYFSAGDRSKYSVDLIIQYGINLPLIEYQVAEDLGVSLHPQPMSPTIWFDTERDPLGFLWAALKSGSLCPFGRIPVFPYLGHADKGPLIFALSRAVQRLIKGAWRKITRSIMGQMT